MTTLPQITKHTLTITGCPESNSVFSSLTYWLKYDPNFPLIVWTNETHASSPGAFLGKTPENDFVSHVGLDPIYESPNLTRDWSRPEENDIVNFYCIVQTLKIDADISQGENKTQRVIAPTDLPWCFLVTHFRYQFTLYSVMKQSIWHGNANQ